MRPAVAAPVAPVALVALVALVACKPAPLPPIVEGPVDPSIDVPIRGSFWIPGERLRFDLRFRGVVLAEMTMAAGEPGVMSGREVIVVRSLASTAGVVSFAGVRASESATSWLDRRDGAAVERRTRLDDNGEIRAYALRFSPGAIAVATVEPDGRETSSWSQPTPPERVVFDNQGILGLLRAWRPEPGTSGSFWAFTDRILNRHVVRFSGFEMLSTATRHARTRRYDADIFSPSGQRRRDQAYRIWITDDDRRTPLRMEIPHRFGRLILELRDHQIPGRQPRQSGA